MCKRKRTEPYPPFFSRVKQVLKDFVIFIDIVTSTPKREYTLKVIRMLAITVGLCMVLSSLNDAFDLASMWLYFTLVCGIMVITIMFKVWGEFENE